MEVTPVWFIYYTEMSSQSKNKMRQVPNSVNYFATYWTILPPSDRGWWQYW